MMKKTSNALISEERPTKPGLSILLPFALLLWLACALTYNASFLLSIDSCIRYSLIAAVAFLVASLLCISKKIRPLALMCISLSLGCAFGFFGAGAIHSKADAAIRDSGQWHLSLISDAKDGAFGSSAYALSCGPHNQTAKIFVQFRENVELFRGDELTLSASPKTIKESSSEFYWSQGVGCSITADTYELVVRDGIISALQNIRKQAISLFGEFGGDQAGLLQALACGYRQGIEDSGIYEYYKRCGLAHLVAVSGAHLGIVTILFRWLLSFLKMPRIAVTIILIAFVLAYLVLAGVPISALRAAFMVVLSLLSPFAKRRDSAISALALCIIVFICTDPAVSISASFVLSVGSTLGILLFAGLVSSWFSSCPNSIRKTIGAPIGMTLASNVATLPYSMALFSQLPLVAPLANIAATPLFTISCVGALLGAVISCMFPAAAAVIVQLAAISVMPLSVAVEFLADIPFGCIAISVSPWAMLLLSVAMCFTLWFLWPSLHLNVAMVFFICSYAAVAIFIFLSPLTKADEIVMLDVAQGDSFLVRSKGSSILIDTGNQDSLLKEGLANLGVYKLDAVVITHPDDDHCSSLESLSTYMQIDRVYSSKFLLNCECENCSELRNSAERASDSELQGLSVGDTLKVGIFSLRVIWPNEYKDKGGNSDSVCLLCEADCNSDGICDYKTLFTGDAEAEQLDELLNSGSVGDIDVLKVGHHGSKISLTKAISNKLQPEIALISCGANNKYGHPSDEALECLDTSKCIMRTDINGQTSLTFKEEGIEIKSSS